MGKADGDWAAGWEMCTGWFVGLMYDSGSAMAMLRSNHMALFCARLLIPATLSVTGKVKHNHKDWCNIATM